MFDIGWTEMAVIALVALMVIGPKELPNAMRAAAKWARKARSLAREFQSGVDDMIREADLEDARKAAEAARSLDLEKTIGDTLDPSGGLRDEARALENAARDAETAAPGADDVKGDAADAPPNIAPPHSVKPPRESDGPAPSPEPVGDSPDKRVS